MKRIKICGLINKKDALAAASLGAWAVGFIFYKKSLRVVEPKVAKKIIEALPKGVIPVGVFVNETEANINQIAKECKLRAIQFHGEETPAFCAKFKKYKTIKAIRIKNAKDLNAIKRYKTDFYLLDTYEKGLKGGTGKVFDWTILKAAKIPAKNVILSGGLNPKNIAQAIVDVKAYAYDTSSGVERRPGKKCQRLLKNFVSAAKGAKG
ncbi:MAG: phosphoribosylanthranilate isomerase [Candidatus Aceula meridiana]|nr:phosphoribosylanthranilate isomerase [Candidatus Aceula meridiana]